MINKELSDSLLAVQFFCRITEHDSHMLLSGDCKSAEFLFIWTLVAHFVLWTSLGCPNNPRMSCGRSQDICAACEGVANMARANDSPLTCTSAPLSCFSLSYSASHLWKTRQSDMVLVGMLTQRRSCVSSQRSTRTFFVRPFAGTSSSVPRPWWHSEHLIYMSRLPGTNSFLGAQAISSCTALSWNEIFFKC